MEIESKIDDWIIFSTKHSVLDVEFLLLEDISEILPFPHLDRFELENLPSSEPLADYADFLADLVDGVEEGKGEISQEKRNSTEDKIEKRKRGRPANKKSLREKRRAANSREKERMRALVRWREIGFP